MEPIDQVTSREPGSIAGAKLSYSVHLVPPEALGTAVRSLDVVPREGDLVLARVEVVGQIGRLELPSGRRAALFPGDDIVAVYGGCCAPEQHEAQVPSDLGACDLVTGGGVAGLVLSTHSKVGAPTRIQPLCLLADTDGRRLNLADWRLPFLPRERTDVRPTTLVVMGTASRSGTGSVAGALVQGLVRSGRTVGAAKVTGTGGGDMWLLADGGGSPVLDVTHAGRPSTHRLGRDGLADVFMTLSGHLAHAAVDVMVLVMAQTFFDAETIGLLASEEGAGGVDAIVFTAADALSAMAGVSRIEALGLPVAAVAGTLSASPLATREAQEALPHVPILNLDDLAHPCVAEQVSDIGHDVERRIGRPA